MKRYTLLLLLILLVVSAQAQSFGRLKEPGEKKDAAQLMALEQAAEPIALEQMIDPNTYRLGPGDEIGLSILSSEGLTFSLKVTPTGDLFIPAVGLCHVAGMTLSDAMKIVEKFVSDSAFPGAKTYMALLKPRFFKVPVSGAVIEPSFVIVTPVTRLDDAIFQVDGFHQLAKEYDIHITHMDGTMDVINYHKYILEGDMGSNPTLIEGDRILVPFGAVDENGIVVRGSITGAGYDIIAPNESLAEYIQRQVTLQKNADLKNITLSRNIDGVTQHIVVPPEDFGKTILQPKDEINFMWERGVMVTGFVQSPGGFSYFPGYSVSDYIALAGGNTLNGNPQAVSVSHLDGDIQKGMEIRVARGDVIYVPRTRKDIFIGDMSVLSVITAFLTVYLAYLSAIGN